MTEHKANIFWRPTKQWFKLQKKQVIIQNLLFIRKYLRNIFHIITASCANNVIGLGHLYFLPEKKCKTGIIDR